MNELEQLEQCTYKVKFHPKKYLEVTTNASSVGKCFISQHNMLNFQLYPYQIFNL
jgi:hypothetical protein